MGMIEYFPAPGQFGIATKEWFAGPQSPSVAAADAPLACLAGGALASRFHAWYGLSGRRYICSVFPVVEEAAAGGLPEFEAGIVIATAKDRRGQRRALAAFELSWDGESVKHKGQIDAALKAGASEWHVHLLAESLAQRRASLADLAGLALNSSEARASSELAREPFQRLVADAEFREMGLGVSNIIRIGAR
jgi:hypothetical protein